MKRFVVCSWSGCSHPHSFRTLPSLQKETTAPLTLTSQPSTQTQGPRQPCIDFLPVCIGLFWWLSLNEIVQSVVLVTGFVHLLCVSCPFTSCLASLHCSTCIALQRCNTITWIICQLMEGGDAYSFCLLLIILLWTYVYKLHMKLCFLSAWMYTQGRNC